jgi:hypothetical protein
MLGVLQRLAPEAARRYHLVVLSDHGQSQGATFRQRYGETLDELVDRFSAPDVADAPEAPAEQEVTEEPGFPEPPIAPLLVVSSGNLALLYLTHSTERLNRMQIDEAYPRLIPGLATHPGVGLVVVDDDGPVAIGTSGTHRLLDGTVEGVDPLLPYGPHARGDLLRHQESEHIGDLVLISCVDPVTQEVAAFEELVGSHGGLGGWQTDAVLVHPSDWPITENPLNGSDAMHRQLVEWLVMLGLRTPSAALDGVPALEAGDPVRLDGLRTAEGERDGYGFLRPAARRPMSQ